jgi:hypothetical protein
VARRMLGLCVVLAVVLVACGSGPVATVQPTEPPAGSVPAASGGGGLVPVPGGFDFDRVKQMDAADLPEGIPVPVPFGGVIDDLHGVSEGQSLIVDYDPRFFATAAAFYQTWIANEGLDASPLMSSGGDLVGWEMPIDGQQVRVELRVSDDGSATRLVVLWP